VRISKSDMMSRRHIMAQVTDQGLLVVAKRPCVVKRSSGTETDLATNSLAVLSQGDRIELLYHLGPVGTEYEVH
jgi:hypothetical protein